MKPNGNGLKMIQDNNGQGTGGLPSSRVQIVAAAVGLALLLVGGASKMPQSNSDRSNDAGAQPTAEVQMQAEPTTLDYFPDSSERAADRASAPAGQAAAAAFVYFPAQYENQGREKEEHIQAF